MKIYDIWCSGGRDSVAASIAALNSLEDKNARMVFIDEFRLPRDLGVPRAIDYVREFSEWLGVDLVVIEPEVDYWEMVKRYGYPGLLKNRWCLRVLKLNPIKKFLEAEVSMGYRPTWVLGIRRSESRRRERIYKYGGRYHYRYGKNYVEIWLPILYLSKSEVDDIIKRYKPPKNPLWEMGFSMECICMAGMTRRRLDIMISRFPKLAKYLADMDREVQSSRIREEPIRPWPLSNVSMPLHKYIEERLRQKTIDIYID